MGQLDLPGASAAAEAFARFDAWLERELLPQAGDAYACGDEAFALLLRHGHFLELSTDELERLALERMAEQEAVLARGAPADQGATVRDDYLGRFAEVW